MRTKYISFILANNESNSKSTDKDKNHKKHKCSSLKDDNSFNDLRETRNLTQIIGISRKTKRSPNK